MPTWIIGDIQGCLASFETLLTELNFDPAQDRLWLVGDLVNRGPASAGVLRLVEGFGTAAITVLGNHDLHLLAVAARLRPASPGDTLNSVLDAPDRDALLTWLAAQPLMHEEGGDVLVHAGLAPAWSLEEALEQSREVERELRGPRRNAFLSRMYGNEPDLWQDAADTEGRQRFTVNACTRMRFVDADGRLLMKAKSGPEAAGADMLPWFLAPHRRPAGLRVFFGHWSTLGRIAWPEAGVWGLDTGCVWNGRLTALCRETLQLVSVPAAPGDGQDPTGAD